MFMLQIYLRASLVTATAELLARTVLHIIYNIVILVVEEGLCKRVSWFKRSFDLRSLQLSPLQPEQQSVTDSVTVLQQ